MKLSLKNSMKLWNVFLSSKLLKMWSLDSQHSCHLEACGKDLRTTADLLNQKALEAEPQSMFEQVLQLIMLLTVIWEPLFQFLFGKLKCHYPVEASKFFRGKTKHIPTTTQWKSQHCLPEMLTMGSLWDSIKHHTPIGTWCLSLG